MRFSPWQLGPSQDFIAPLRDIGYVKPRSYRFIGEQPVPYEWSYSPEKPTTDDLKTHAAFFTELSKLLQKLGLQDLFGVRDITGHNDPNLPLEITEGKVYSPCGPDIYIE